MVNERDMCHPQMKVPTFATLQPNFMKNFESEMPDLVGETLIWPLMVCGGP